MPHKTLLRHFCQSGTMSGKVNMEVSPNIWNRNAFWTTSLHALGVRRYFQRLKLYIWMFHSLIETEKLTIELDFFSMLLSYMWNWNVLQAVILSSNVIWLCYYAYTGIHISFRGRNLHIFQNPKVIGFTLFLKCEWKENFYELTILIPKAFLDHRVLT